MRVEQVEEPVRAAPRGVRHQEETRLFTPLLAFARDDRDGAGEESGARRRAIKTSSS